ncbi:hypothetical protein HKBW3S47_01862 [Candidatus Hakubella thermalkaliphila]|uniref:TACO1/YebC-like N-terminal domain-containing protein n=1 Tax=Candidatus Hakubella thermalkaliphila TaxID=2754717 RepID=A0A6V8Q600_9ACTN|nr:YebC/PmpR family DNA-binding transcriptional regulator [Candidatus Hakubella thermalkaliphila]GFP40165.1 hypothetical protein HKBW3S47_01862 [Candidatus Hakubella thermalkaliphila]
MSGHSKWSTIKRKKAKEDAKRGQMFGKLSRSITVAAREGGGNPDLNATLAAAIEKAKEYNMPQESIERAIKKGTGEISGAKYERMIFVSDSATKDFSPQASSSIEAIFN